jgi:hypothetical protein
MADRGITDQSLDLRSAALPVEGQVQEWLRHTLPYDGHAWVGASLDTREPFSLCCAVRADLGQRSSTCLEDHSSPGSLGAKGYPGIGDQRFPHAPTQVYRQGISQLGIDQCG